jgi:hypothetical protein
MFEVNLEIHKPKRQIDKAYLCAVRKRLIPATPEEEVRQSIINYLLNEKGYPIESLSVEKPLIHFPDGKGKAGRVDIVISDEEENTLCIIECKEPNEHYTDNVIDQILKYDEVVNAESLCIAIGNQFIFLLKEEDKLLKLTEFPSYKTLIENGQVEYFLQEDMLFEKFTFREPIPREEIDFLIENGVIGESTPSEYHPFLVNLYNFFIDRDDVLEPTHSIEDLGIKLTKYGNAGGGQFVGEYRAFLDLPSKAIISFALSSASKGDGFPSYTSLMLAVDVKGSFHLSLELNIEKYVLIMGNCAEVLHDGRITVGKLGAAKRTDLLSFISNRKPELIKDDRIFLGKFDFDKEIRSEQSETKEFIERCIQYALLRDEFRTMKKAKGKD